MTTATFILCFFVVGLPITVLRYLDYLRAVRGKGRTGLFDMAVAAFAFPAMLLCWPVLEIAGLIGPSE